MADNTDLDSSDSRPPLHTNSHRSNRSNGSNMDSEKSELSSHKDKFDAFFKDRQKEKRRGYIRIAKMGFAAAILGMHSHSPPLYNHLVTINGAA